ncbi:MFS transporter [Teredinibacter turnerae]|uniref:MFS transporter n=1 Tax=Teredinibacter turnerae TaxID=2426 RepID=UPI0005A0155C|nr:MFS transporter [Teredinibacter turnerae]
MSDVMTHVDSEDAGGTREVPPAQDHARGAHAWFIIVICLLGISSGPAAFCLASIGLFSEPLSREFGWDRTGISLAVSLMMLFTAISLPVIGRFIDRFGVKKVLIPSVALQALCFLVAPLMQSYWQFIAIYIAIGTIAVGSNSVPYMRLLSTWFDRSRGLAIGIAGSGTGLGFAYVPILTEVLVNHFGWRGGYIGLGVILLLVTLPLVAFALRESPSHETDDSEQEAGTDGAVKQVSGYTLREAIFKREFWSLVTIFMALAFVLYGLIPHLVPLLTDRGVSASKAAQLASAFGAAAFAGRLMIGFLVDRHDARVIAFIFFSLSALGIAIFLLPLPFWTLYCAAILLGGSLGAEVDMLAYLTSRYFGLRSFAEVFSVLFSAVMVAMGLGPLAFGVVFDASGSYQSILMLGIPICVFAVIMLLTLRPYSQRRRGGPVSMT